MALKKKQKLIIIVVSVILLITILLVITLIRKEKQQQIFQEQEKQRVLQYSSINDFKNIEEVMLYLDATFISKEESEIENVDYIIKANLKYDLNLENKNYYEKLIHYSAHVLKYKNFYIVDEQKNNQILVICNPETELIVEYYINEEKFYFDKLENFNNIETFEKEQETQVKNISNLLENIILQNWKINNINLGTKESTYRNYDIYFDEGYEIRKVNGTIFNIIFTEKYNDYVVENIKVNTSNEEIIKILGTPTYETLKIIGYKTKEFYIFFSENQISIYPVVNYETEKMMEIVEKYKTSEEHNLLINEIKNVWKDYDIYEISENKIKLQYTLKGICFQYNSSSERGAILYNNYSGKVGQENTLQNILETKSNLPENIYFHNKNLVFEHEEKRVASIEDYTENRNYATQNILNISKKFKVNIDSQTNTVRFISINKQNANTELREMIDYGIWLDDNTFIYSVKNVGIYKYNVQTQTYSTITQGVADFKLIKIENNKLYYDEKVIEIN